MLTYILAAALALVSVAAVIAIPISLKIALRYARDVQSVGGTPLVLAEENLREQVEAKKRAEARDADRKKQRQLEILEKLNKARNAAHGS